MKAAELRSKSKDELKDLILGMKKEQLNLRLQASMGTLEGTSRVHAVRKEIARAKTVMTELDQPETVKKTTKKKAAAKKPAAKSKKG